MNNYKILVINPGSTSDEVAYFEGEKQIFHEVVRYDTAQMEPYEGKKITEQFEFRKNFVMKELKEHGIDIKNLDAIITRGGLLKPTEGGVFEINETIKDDLRHERYGSHASDLGPLIGDSIAQEIGLKAHLADPTTVDEMVDFARFSGMPENPRICIFHCLNQRRVAHLTAKKLNKDYKDLNLIIVHMGGGISVGAHKQGRVVDVNNALDGEGPFTPQRSGGVPTGGLAKLCFSGKYSFQDIKLMIKGKGGMVAYTGTSDMKILEDFASGKELSEEDRKKIKPDITREKVKLLIGAMAYQISKDICGLTAIFCGKVDAIALSGGLAYSEMITAKIEERTGWIAPVYLLPGGDEMEALRSSMERVLSGKEKVKSYD
ncbi:MAG: butyrate kinase [Candidatus Eremiobacterota bacterium]